MAEVTWSASALSDLKDIYEFIAKDSPYYAEKFVNRLADKAGQLGKYPTKGKMVPEIGNREIKEIREGNYRIIYKLSDDESRIEIIRVHHSARTLKP